MSELRLTKLLAAVENARRSAESRGLHGDAILSSILSDPDVERAFEIAVQERAQDLWFDYVIPDPYAPFDPDITVRQARDDILTALSDYLQEC